VNLTRRSCCAAVLGHSLFLRLEACLAPLRRQLTDHTPSNEFSSLLLQCVFASLLSPPRSFEAFERQYATDNSWESLQEDERGFLRPLVRVKGAGSGGRGLLGWWLQCPLCLRILEERAWEYTASTVAGNSDRSSSSSSSNFMSIPLLACVCCACRMPRLSYVHGVSAP
jgi:hypothetical protein